MRSILRRQNLGDRMIAVIGTLVVAAIAALVGFAFLIASHVDRDGTRRELAIARAELTEMARRMRADLATFSHWGEAVERTAQDGNSNWLHRVIGVRLQESSGHHRTYVLDHTDRPLYAAHDGHPVRPDMYRGMEDVVAPVIHSVRNAHAVNRTYQALASVYDLDARTFPSIEVVHREIEGRPALVGVMAVTSAARGQGRAPRPSVVVSALFLDGGVLEKLAAKLGTERIVVKDERPESGEAGVEVPLGAGDRLAWVAWTPRSPGGSMLLRLLPGLLAVLVLLSGATVLVMRYIRRTTEKLDHSERRATELAYRDRLTGLANRVQLIDTLSDRIVDSGPSRRLALILIDLDDFKDINDTLGHSTGDEVLFAMGERLIGIAGPQGMAVRFGGDEFALLVPITAGTEDVHAICRRVSESVRTQVMAGGQFLTMGSTIGVAIAPDDASDAEQLMRRAEIALYRAKAESRGGYRLFDPSYEEILHRRSAMERELQRALTNEELAVRFQPLFAADGERIVGVEALVRWNHPERGVVPPSEFIPVAEQTGLVIKLDEWVLRRACEHAAQWPGLALSVNLSASNFRQPHVAERLTRVLAETGFDPRRLEIEITESMLLGATSEVLGELSELRRMGMRIALDDFGTGFSSLGYLRRFPVDKLKIDKSFVQNLGITEDAAAIVECVTRLGRALGLAVTAEGVENAEQHRFVRAVGCHQVQGYLFSPPVEAERITEMIPHEAPASGRYQKPRLAAV